MVDIEFRRLLKFPKRLETEEVTKGQLGRGVAVRKSRKEGLIAGIRELLRESFFPLCCGLGVVVWLCL
jgi:hypothetical protein